MGPTMGQPATPLDTTTPYSALMRRGGMAGIMSSGAFRTTKTQQPDGSYSVTRHPMQGYPAYSAIRRPMNSPMYNRPWVS